MLSLLSSSTAVMLRPTLVATVIEDGAVLLDLESKYFYSLNKSAWAIVQLFELGPASVGDIQGRCRDWGGSSDDVPRLLDELERAGLLEFSEQAEPAQAPDYTGPWQPPVVTRQSEPLQNVVTSAFDPSIPLAE